VNGAGTVQDPGGRPIASSGTDEGGPAITSGPPGNAAFGLAYQRFAPESPFGSNRIFLRTHTK